MPVMMIKRLNKLRNRSQNNIDLFNKHYQITSINQVLSYVMIMINIKSSFQTHSIWILLLLCYIKISSCLRYPVTVGGFSDDTILQRFLLDSNSNLYLAALTSDTQLGANTPNQNIIMYFTASSSSWTWAKFIGNSISGEILADMKLRNDQSRIAVIYESSLLVVLNSVNGNIIKSLKSSALSCNLGCFMFYETSILNLIGVHIKSPGPPTYFLGFDTIDPESTVLPSSSLKAYTTMQAFNPLGIRIPGTPFTVISARGATHALLFTLDNTYTNLIAVQRAYPSGKFRALQQLPKGDGDLFRTFGYVEILSTPNKFAIWRCFWYLSAQRMTENQYYEFQEPLTSKIEFLDFLVVSSSVTYAMVYFTSTNQVYLFIGTQTKNPLAQSFTSQLLITSKSYLTLSNRLIRAGTPFRYYFGGNDAYGIFSISLPGQVTKQTAFVFSFQQSESDIQVSSPTTGYSSSNPAGSEDDYFTLQLNGLTVTETTTYSDMNLASSQNSIPTLSAILVPSCLTEYKVTGYPLIDKYYIDDQPFTQTITVVPPQTCSGITCSQLTNSNLGPLVTDVFETWDPATKKYTLKTETDSRDGEVINIMMISIPPGSFLSPCGYFYNYYTLTLIKPLIIPVAIPKIVYNLDDPQLDVVLPTFSNNKGITGDPKLQIQYAVKKIDDTSPFTSGSMFLSFDSTTMVLSIMTSDGSLPQYTQLKLVAWFTYLPSYIVEQTFDIQLQKCFKTTITSPILTNLIYQVGGKAIPYPVSGWSHTFPAECGPFTFTTSLIPIPAISFDPTIPKFNIFTLDPNADGMYQITVTASLYDTNTGIQFKTASVTFTVIIFHPTQSLITPQLIDPASYVLRDPALNIVGPIFPTNRPYLNSQYELLMKNGEPPNPEIVRFDPVERKIQIKTDDLKYIGVYYLKIRARFSSDTKYYVESLPFEVKILHWCVRNIINAPVADPQQYILGEPELVIKISSWTQSMGQDCPKLAYKQPLQSGDSFPQFIKFNREKLQLKIKTPLIKDVGQYNLKISALSKYFDQQQSDMTLTFSLRVICYPKRILVSENFSQVKISKDIFTGLPIPQDIKYTEFQLDPKCTGRGNEIQYFLTDGQGRNLPKFITLNQDERKIQIQDTESLKPGKLQLILQGTNKDLKAHLIINLNIQSGLGTIGGKYLDPISIMVEANQTKPAILKSENFKNHTSKPYYIHSNDKTILSFLKFWALKQEVHIQPSILDIGEHKFYLLSETDQDPAQKLIQIVEVKVVPPRNSSLEYRPIQAVISRISNRGLVSIDFNQKLQRIKNSTRTIDETVLLVTLKNKNGSFIESDLLSNWTLQNFFVDKPSGSIYERGFAGSRMLIQLNFKDPMKISIQEYLYLSIIVLNRTIFRSQESGILIQSRYSLFKKIPRQLDTDAVSYALDYLTTQLMRFIKMLEESSSIVQFLFAFAMSRVWGMIKSIQIILLFPLTLVDIPPNVQLLYYFMTYSCNAELIPSDLALMVDRSNPYNDRFDDQGYKSLFFLENAKSSFNNVNIALVMGISVHLIGIILKRFNKEYKIFDFIYAFLTYNLVINMLMDYAFQHIIFAMVNIRQVDKIKATTEVMSYCLSWLYLIIYLVLTIGILRIVNLHFDLRETRTKDLCQKYPQVSTLFQQLRAESKGSQIYYAIFLIRRFVLAAIIVYIQDHFFQVYTLTLSSLCSIYYMIRYRPFSKPAINRLETFNEIMVVCSCYHLFAFSDVHDEHLIKYQFGWSLNLLILLQLFVNMMTELLEMFEGIRHTLKMLKKKWQNKRRAKIYQKEQSDEFKSEKQQNQESKNVDQSLNKIEEILPQKQTSQIQESLKYQMSPSWAQKQSSDTPHQQQSPHKSISTNFEQGPISPFKVFQLPSQPRDQQDTLLDSYFRGRQITPEHIPHYRDNQSRTRNRNIQQIKIKRREWPAILQKAVENQDGSIWQNEQMEEEIDGRYRSIWQ